MANVAVSVGDRRGELFRHEKGATAFDTEMVTGHAYGYAHLLRPPSLTSLFRRFLNQGERRERPQIDSFGTPQTIASATKWVSAVTVMATVEAGYLRCTAAAATAGLHLLHAASL